MSNQIKINLGVWDEAIKTIEGVEVHAKDLVREMMKAIREDIINSASAGLHTSLADYKSSLSNVRMRKGGGQIAAYIELNGTLANWIENGKSPFDMHATILGKRGEVSKDGHLYAVVPFTHVKPGAGGRTPMGMQYGIPMDTKALGAKVYSYAKDIGNKPHQASSMPGGLFPKIHTNARDVGKWRAEGHSHDPFADMKRMAKKTGKGTELKTFRTISDAVPNKWYHPGITAHNFFDKAEANVDRAAVKAMTAILDNMSKGLKK